MDAIIFIGIQASGKSSFYRAKFYDTHVRINLDMLKTRQREKVFLQACLDTKQPFVIDNTNVTAAEREKCIEAAKSAGFVVTGYYFRSSLKDALARNKQRSGRALIPEKGVVGTFKRLELPRREEGFDQLYYVEINESGEFIIKEWSDEI